MGGGSASGFQGYSSILDSVSKITRTCGWGPLNQNLIKLALITTTPPISNQSRKASVEMYIYTYSSNSSESDTANYSYPYRKGSFVFASEGYDPRTCYLQMISGGSFIILALKR